ncbi:flagellar hook-associated protein FlgL [Sporolituus thermophilus]|uniref:Flagellar hook-associated protein 3 FlgL n=1 Tax=Sporolituus thermophilus DSM 23256 TaxID=1123285 RepID=A0A1G7P007_9FIRM|nr:flagellar hook-associated protein FlgL [Sporolituus thermophilus]SDF79564.1 flagellar hook-associated protein 3 FlgL [Sporolituus thermophilus DSM 23256]
MRITNNIITYNFLNSLNKALERQNEIQEQLADGKAVHRPSDDPIKTIRSLRFNTNLAMNEQFTQNVKDAMSWLETTDGALSDLSSIVIRAKELVVRAVGPNPTEAFQAIAQEINGLIDHAVQVGNTKIGDRYIFAGQKDKTTPFERRMVDPDPSVAGDEYEAVVYSGDTNAISMRIYPGNVQPQQDAVNVTGEDVFGLKSVTENGQTIYIAKAFDQLLKIKAELEKPNPDLKWLSGEIVPPATEAEGLAWIDDIHNQILRAQTKIGTRMSMYEMAQNMLEQDNVTITGDISANEDLDMPKAIIDFKTSENVYRSALAVGARIMPASLVDFLK